MRARPANRTRSSSTYCTIQSDPKVAMLAASTAIVRPVVPSWALVAQAAARLTASVDKPSPAKESAQNGPISASTDRWPVRPQTQRRFSSNDGTVPSAVAVTLAQAALMAPVATSTPSTERLAVVEMAETVA
jgi:hypothetical protein